VPEGTADTVQFIDCQNHPIHILGILQNVISDVHILTENKSIYGHLPNYKEYKSTI